MKKILITIQGRTLILYYQVKHDPAGSNSGLPCYIQVLPSSELARFDLKGLTPEMFCVNISDMVNIHGLYSGQVENERQIPVAKWAINYDEYLQLKISPKMQLTHQQLVNLLAPLPGYLQESDNMYIDFGEGVVPHHTDDHATSSGYRLTIVTEDIEGNITSHAYYNLDTRTAEGWQGTPPPLADHEPVRVALANQLQRIKESGVQLSHVYDETDYTITRQNENNS